MNSAILIVYLANVLVAGWISLTCLFAPRTAASTIFSQAYAYSEAIRLIGALWGAIFVLSFIGIFLPYKMSLVLLFQLIYKSTWLVVSALPAVIRNEPYPKAMTMFFIIWVLILPFVIPWRHLFFS